MELCDNDPIFHHRVFDQNLNLPLYPSHQKDRLAKTGALRVDDRPRDHNPGSRNHPVHPMSADTFVLGRIGGKLLATDRIRQRGMGSSWYGSLRIVSYV